MTEPRLHSEGGAVETCTGRLVHTDPRGARVVELPDRPLDFGRGPEGVDHVLPGGRVSRRHFRLEPVPGDGHLLVDLGSANGTWVNDRRVASALLAPFDRVRAGNHLLVYLDPQISAEKVLELLALGDTRGGFSPAKSRLAERLLGLAIAVQERGSELELVSTLDEVLEELTSWTGHAGALLVAEEAEAARTLRVLHARGVPAERLPSGRALEGLYAALEPALGARQVVRVETALGPTLCIPMDSRSGADRRRARHPGEVHGALLLTDPAAQWEPSEEEEGLLRGLTRQLALVISKARLERQVTTDLLTELPNRAWLERLLGEELLRARDEALPVGVVLLDLDDFKRVNDTHGHATGDAVLRHVADRLRWALRHTDSAGRWGGEEFLIVLPGTDLEGAGLVADKVVQLIGSSAGPDGLSVTASAGVAAAPAHGHDQHELLQRADEALYAAKRAGKNRYRVWSPELHAAPAVGPETRRLSREDEPLWQEPVAWLDCDLLPSFPLHPGTTVLGRSPSCELVLPHRSVSRQHALLHVSSSGQVTFEDCSLNGTYVNGEVALEAVELAPGARLEVGPYQLILRREQPTDVLGSTPAREMIGGRLEGTNLCDFLLRLESTHATGTLAVHADQLEGELRLRRGQPVSARAGPSEGVEAVRLLLSRQKGAYAFVHGPAVDEPCRIPLTTSGLLLLTCPHAQERAEGEGCTGRGCRALEATKARRQHLTC